MTVYRPPRALLHVLLVGPRGERPRPYVPQRLTLWDDRQQRHILAEMDAHGAVDPADFLAALERVFDGHGHLVVRTELYQVGRWPNRPFVRYPDRLEVLTIANGHARRLSQQELDHLLGKPTQTQEVPFRGRFERRREEVSV